jgi:hypothetical protein
MRWNPTRLLTLIGVMVTLAIGSTAGAAAEGQAGLEACPAGRVGLVVHWSEAQVTSACTTEPSQQTTPGEIVAVVVRWSDGTTSTVRVTDAEGSDTQTSSSSVSSVGSSSSSVSTSTTCINGQCTTTGSHSVCTDLDCSVAP